MTCGTLRAAQNAHNTRSLPPPCPKWPPMTVTTKRPPTHPPHTPKLPPGGGRTGRAWESLRDGEMEGRAGQLSESSLLPSWPHNFVPHHQGLCCVFLLCQVQSSRGPRLSCKLSTTPGKGRSPSSRQRKSLPSPLGQHAMVGGKPPLQEVPPQKECGTGLLRVRPCHHHRRPEASDWEEKQQAMHAEVNASKVLAE